MATGRAARPNPYLITFGLHLRQLRVGRSLTQEQLAHNAGLHRTVVGFIERGERDIGISTLWPLAAALNVTVAELFG